MSNDEISDEARQARFKRWEALGLEQVKADLQGGGYRVVGGPPQVRALAWEWVRLKEEQRRTPEISPEDLRSLGIGQTPLERILSGRSGLDDVLAQIAREDSVRPAAGQTHAFNAPAAKTTEKQTEILTLKPSLMGVSVDVKELVRRFFPKVSRFLRF